MTVEYSRTRTHAFFEGQEHAFKFKCVTLLETKTKTKKKGIELALELPMGEDWSRVISLCTVMLEIHRLRARKISTYRYPTRY